MNETQKAATDFVTYEYKTLTVGRNLEFVWRDSYQNFGWKLEKSVPAVIKHIWGPIRLLAAPLAIFPGSPLRKIVYDHKSETEVDLEFKRDRKIPSKAELNRLQSQFESCVKEVDDLEKSRNSVATAVAYIVGLIGTVFMALSVFSYLAGMIYFCIFLAVPGFVGWIIPYFCFVSICRKRARKVAPLIDQKYDELYEVCEKANILLEK